jgi:hypothetical protein
MPRLFRELEERLLRAGVEPRHVRRYVAELRDHLADLSTEEARTGKSRADAEAAALRRLGDVEQLAAAMEGRSEFQSWSARAPLAVFGVGSLACLAVGYFVACFILWSGWRMFLPGSVTPFGGRLEGLPALYFGVGRMLYFWAPVLVGWWMGVLAARQRVRVVWPVVGMALVAWVGCMRRVHAIRPESGGVGGHVSMGLEWPSGAGDWMYWLVMVAVTAGPYLVWRMRREWVV